MLRAVREAGATLLPCDSEHNAIFQSLADGNRDAVEKIILTASGGPFRTASLEEMAKATPEAALRHPVWSMGAKISIDSATMMNKGLEVIEAAHLFDAGRSNRRAGAPAIGDPRHGLLSRRLGPGAARLAGYAHSDRSYPGLAWAYRTPSPRLDLAAVARLDFAEPDLVRFPSLRLAREALWAGGGAPALLNAANEIAVAAFLQRKIGFLDIAGTVAQVMDPLGTPPADTLDEVIALDQTARRAADRFAAARAA